MTSGYTDTAKKYSQKVTINIKKEVLKRVCMRKISSLRTKRK
jgi:hypothetical protein